MLITASIGNYLSDLSCVNVVAQIRVNDLHKRTFISLFEVAPRLEECSAFGGFSLRNST